MAKRGEYQALLQHVSGLLEGARRSAARSINAVMTATYWEIGRRIIEYEQRGVQRAAYGEALLKRLLVDLMSRFGRGFSERNLEQMRLFYLGWPISQTPSAKSQPAPARHFPLPWSHYVRLLSVEEPAARAFYCAKHDEAVAHYALGGLSHKVFASRYKLRLPAPEILRREIEAERRRLEQRLQVSSS